MLGAVLLAKLLDNITKSLETELELQLPRCYTDSKAVYYWICGIDKDWKPFVNNRVNTIRKLAPASCWDHCPGRLNPADAPSRGRTPLEFVNDSAWFNGPEWVLNSMGNHEDTSTQITQIPVECEPELKSKDRQSNTHNLLSNEEASVSVIKIDDYSDLRRLLRVTARVIMFIARLRKREDLKDMHQSIAQAEILWVKEAQRLLISDQNFEVWKRQFDLFYDQDGILRCRGRLKHAELSYGTKYPIILSKVHTFTKLVVQQAHERVFHNGLNETLTETRTKYWIIQGRSLVKTLISRCYICRKFEALHHHLLHYRPSESMKHHLSPLLE